MVGAEREADAGVEVHGRPADQERRLEHVAQPLRRRRGRRAVDVAHQHAELVAAEAGQHLSLAHGGGEASADAADEIVSDVVAEAVVHLLEAVEVEQHDGESVVGASLGQRVAQQAVERTAVGQARQVVGQRLSTDEREGPDLPEGQQRSGQAAEDGSGGEDHGDQGQVDEAPVRQQAEAEEAAADRDEQRRIAREVRLPSMRGGGEPRSGGDQGQTERPSGVPQRAGHPGPRRRPVEEDGVADGERDEPQGQQQPRPGRSPREQREHAHDQGQQHQVGDGVAEVGRHDGDGAARRGHDLAHDHRGGERRSGEAGDEAVDPDACRDRAHVAAQHQDDPAPHRWVEPEEPEVGPRRGRQRDLAPDGDQEVARPGGPGGAPDGEADPGRTVLDHGHRPDGREHDGEHQDPGEEPRVADVVHARGDVRARGRQPGRVRGEHRDEPTADRSGPSAGAAARQLPVRGRRGASGVTPCHGATCGPGARWRRAAAACTTARCTCSPGEPLTT